MASYISSNANRFYTVLESAYGEVAAVEAINRVPALKLAIQQQSDLSERKDKTGSRTFSGSPAGGRRRTTFELRTYLTSWSKTGQPGYGPLFQAALGGAPLSFTGGVAAFSTESGELGFAAPHGLVAGQAVSFGGEIRFVTALVNDSSVRLNAPFTVAPGAGAAIGSAITYVPATELPSVTVFDYWSPTSAVQRMLPGAAIDQMSIQVNGDYHEVHFKGVAKDVLDSASISGGPGQLLGLPPEPELDGFDYAIVPGNLGQAWLGSSATQFLTITGASIVLRNAVETRSREFGSSVPRGIYPGQRSVTVSFDLYSQDDEATKALYQAARQQSPIAVMLQLGEVEGQLMGVYLQSVIPEVPEFDDSENRLQWRFRASRAQGTIDNEIAVAFA